jgi:branched-chain amino acid transport system substrate-binding protein
MMGSMKRVPVVIAAAILAMAPSACRFEKRVQERETLTIGALLALTGSGANYGKSLRQGIEIAREEINHGGGINGKMLEVVYEDSQGDAKTGVAGFEKLATVDGVPLVIGSISSVILAVAPIADRRQVILVNSSAISPRICEQATNFLFSLMPSGADEARFIAGEFIKGHRSEGMAVLYSNNASGVDTKDTFVRELQSAGGRVTDVEGYELGATDFRAQLAKIKNSKAKYGFLIAFSSAEFGGILRQSRELGLEIKWYSYSGIETKETLELAGSAAEGVIYSYPSYSRDSTKMETFQRKYQETYGSWADIYTVTSYDGLNLLAYVMAKYGTSPLRIRDGLRRTGDHNGVFGELRFQQTRQCVETHLMWKTVKGGKYVPLQ